MKGLLSVILFAGVLALPQPRDAVTGGASALHQAASKNCRMVDMCRIRNGKRECFKKRVCDNG